MTNISNFIAALGNLAEKFSVEDLWKNKFDLEALRNACAKLQIDESALNDLILLSNKGSVAEKWYLGDAYYGSINGKKDLSISSK